MSLHNLLSQKTQFLLFGGKGGVGKTTMAAATALQLAARRKVLLFTTDPAPSLGNSFGQRLGNEPQQIHGVKNLSALEINAKQVLKEFKEEYGKEIRTIIEQGSYVSDEEAEEIFSLDVPGLDEVMGLKKITDFMESEEYDLYLVDTAPTGHTLRLLALPDLLDDWVKMLAKLRWRYHTIVKSFSGQTPREPADDFLLTMKRTVSRVQRLLTDAARTEFVVVTIPEAMGVAQTKDLVAELTNFRIPSRHMILNNLVPASRRCQFCRARRRLQDRYRQEIRKTFASYNLTEVEQRPGEVRGQADLHAVADELFGR